MSLFERFKNINNRIRAIIYSFSEEPCICDRRMDLFFHICFLLHVLCIWHKLKHKLIIFLSQHGIRTWYIPTNSKEETVTQKIMIITMTINNNNSNSNSKDSLRDSS